MSGAGDGRSLDWPLDGPLDRPLLRVVRGEPTAEEIAALVAVLASRARPGGTGRVAGRRAGPWADRDRALRGPLPHGPGAWRASAMPR